MIPASYQQLLNITLRYVDTDRDSVLAYAPEPRIAAVLLFSQEKTVRGEADMARMTHALIERVLDIGGTYYLPYRPHASLDQLSRGYPRAAEFAAQQARGRSRPAVPQPAVGRLSRADCDAKAAAWENCVSIALVYMVILLAAASLNYIPGLTDAEGRAFGVFALDIFDDALHVASALWAGISAVTSSRASRIFLRYFGLLYLTRRPARPGHRIGLPRSRHHQPRHARPAVHVQDPGEPAAHRRRRVRRLRELALRRRGALMLRGSGRCGARSGESLKWPLVAALGLRGAAADTRSATSSSPAAATASAQTVPAADHRSARSSAVKPTPTSPIPSGTSSTPTTASRKR